MSIMTETTHVVVIILSYNQRPILLKCLESLNAIQDPAFDVLVWDNGSSDDTVMAVQAAWPDVYIYPHGSNLGVASGRNAAAQMAIDRFVPSHLLFLDNDMILDPGFVYHLLAPFAEDPQLGQTQAKLRFMDDPQRLNDGGGSQINFMFGRTMPVGFEEIDRGQYDSPKACVACGGAMMVRRDVFLELGGFDEAFSPFGPEDIDFSLRLQKAGYKALYVPMAVAYHAVNHTYGKGYTEDYARHKSRHWFLFMKRHATPRQKLAFYAIGAPLLIARMIIREGARGNLGAVRGIIKGAFDFLRTSPE